MRLAILLSGKTAVGISPHHSNSSRKSIDRPLTFFQIAVPTEPFLFQKLPVPLRISDLQLDFYANFYFWFISRMCTLFVNVG